MNTQAYLSAMKLRPAVAGGQELILGEVIAALYPYSEVWLPYGHPSETLVRRLERLGFDTSTAQAAGSTVCYFGTPTIVDDRPLFPTRRFNSWTKERERDEVRDVAETCAAAGLIRRIVCGLGSGDISVEERVEDLAAFGKAEVVCVKRFDGFTDWVLRADA